MLLRRTNISSTVKAAHRHHSTTSYSIENCPLRSFAKNHPEVARLVLNPPPFTDVQFASFDLSNTSYEGESLEGYLKWRGWADIKPVLDEHGLSNEVGSAVGLISHPLTFPLTLGRHVTHFVQEQAIAESHYSMGKDERPHRICCVGARSECTLPDDYWREFLVMSSAGAFRGINEATRSSRGPPSPVDWVIDFVGPDVPKQLQTKTISLDVTEELQPRIRHSLTMNYHTSFLHKLILQLLKQLHSTTKITKIDRLETLQQYWDAFVLFNPGLGHPNLARDWESTIDFLLRTKKPILLTAHSEKDALRDLQALRDRISEEGSTQPAINAGYQLNPYASLMKFRDPFASDNDPVHIVRPNHSVLLLNADSA